MRPRIVIGAIILAAETVAVHVHTTGAALVDSTVAIIVYRAGAVFAGAWVPVRIGLIAILGRAVPVAV